MTTEKGPCSAEGCSKKGFATGLCSAHYYCDLRNRKENQRKKAKMETNSVLV